MSMRFPDEGTKKSDGGKTPDTTLSCMMCEAQMQDARIVPGCLHTFCKSCLERHSSGHPTFSCPKPSCNQVIKQPVESLPANSYFNSLAALESDNEGDKLFLVGNTKSSSNSSSQASLNAPLLPPPTSNPANNRLQQQTTGIGQLSPSFPNTDAASLLPPNTANAAPGGGIVTTPLHNGAQGGIAPPANYLGLPQYTVRSNAVAAATAASDVVWKPWAKPAVLPGLESLNLGDTTWKPSEPWGGADTTAVLAASLLDGAGGSNPQVPHQKCGACDENHLVTSHCRDCQEDLCESCVIAHQRVKLTRDHVISHYADVNNANRQTFTPHSANDSDVIRVYKETAEKSRHENKRLCEVAKEGLAQCEKALMRITAREREIVAKREIITRNVHQMIEGLTMYMREQETFLLERINRISQVKCLSLEDQQQNIRKSQLLLGEIYKALEDNNMSDRLAIENNKKYTQIMEQIKREVGPLEPYEDDVINFMGPDETFMNSMTKIGYVSSSGFYKNCKVEGDGLKKGVLGHYCRFIVTLKDHLGEPCISQQNLGISIQSPDNHKVGLKVGEVRNGQYPVQWRPHVEGEHRIYIQLNSASIPGSPFTCMIRACRNYQTIGEPSLVFGTEGAADGEFCRPWGVCCTKDGRIVVADRSNNRIQVFLPNGTFLYKFGVEGRGNGQFNKPASVAIDSRNRLIVTDKDNHRVQIFDIEGNFLHKFGEKGGEHGNFNYPWDVACNSRDQILVSDTRNHRLQLFTPTGEYITMYGFDQNNWKNFDSPRGVCFSADDQVLVTDFNLHRLLVMGANFENAQFLGKQGSENGEFTRPNGVTVDEEGNIIVADSRNNRIQIFSNGGTFIKKFGEKGNRPGELETPQGICMTPDGKIVVVDSHNRIQIF